MTIRGRCGGVPRRGGSGRRLAGCSEGETSPTQQQKIITLVDSILDAKKQNPSCDTTAQETAIDKEVYALYGLTTSEIATVRARNKDAKEKEKICRKLM